MKLTVNGDIADYYVQTLCMIFFPGAKFSRSEIYTPDTPQVEVWLRKDEGGGAYIAEAVIYAYGKKESGASSAEIVSSDLNSENSAVRAKNIAVGGAVYNAGRKLFGYNLPWGILVGVRPSKVAMEFLGSGLNEAETAEKLCRDFFVSPEKAKIVSEVAAREKNIIAKYSDPLLCSVYISVPFCPSRCSYCSFTSYATKKLLKLIPDYIEKLKTDIQNTFRLINELGMKPSTVYIGGGTPTVLSSPQLDEILAQIEESADLSQVGEYTLEAGRPDTITAEKLKTAKKRGINRISVNTQTLNNGILEKIGRNHTADDFFRGFETALKSGIKNINTDLIAGLPGESFDSFASSLDQVISLRPGNITVHTFCVKKSAEMLKNNINLYSPENAEAEKCINYSQKMLVKNAYYPYYMYRQKNTAGNLENTGFSLGGCEGLYNIFMMEEVHSIFAAGAGAVTKYLRRGKDGNIEIQRIFSSKYPYEYLRSMNMTEQAPDEAYQKQKEKAEAFFLRN